MKRSRYQIEPVTTSPRIPITSLPQRTAILKGNLSKHERAISLMDNKARLSNYKSEKKQNAQRYSLNVKVDFEEIRRASQAHILPILHRLLPDGRIKGSQYFARNPKRNDKSLGSFSVNFKTGQWADFATNDRGGDLISLCAYLHDLSQKESAQRIAQMVGI